MDFSLVHSVLMEQVNGHTKKGSFMHGHMLAQETLVALLYNQCIVSIFIPHALNLH